VRLILISVVAFAGVLAAQTTEIRSQADVDRIRALVDAGAVPRATLEKAEREIADVRDEVILRQTLYGSISIEELTSEQASAMVDAAQRRVDRQKEKLEAARKLVDMGVASRTTLTSIIEDFDAKARTVDLAKTRARLLEEMAEMARNEAREIEREEHDDRSRIAVRYDGNGVFRDTDFLKVSTAFSHRFLRPLPVSARGETALHKSLGFDHRGRVDVALNPDQEEGIWLRKYLETAKIPYFAFRAAIPGQATAPHIHLGPPSLRYHATAD
jgi:hypothetical protein